MKIYYVYILASEKYGTLYIGVTSDIIKRVHQHRIGEISGFAKKYECYFLVHYESTNDVQSAIQREKQLKKWQRRWKIELIEKENPNWEDLYERLLN